MTGTRAIGIDVGGTTIKAVAADAEGRVLEEFRAETPAPDPRGEGLVEAVAALVTQLGTNSNDAPVGVVVPGIVDETRGLAVHSANIGWKDLPLAAMLRRRLGHEIGFGHDVRAGALAEATWGAASGEPGVVAFVPIGTGIAAAILVDGVPLVSGGWAGEIGQVLLPGGEFRGERLERIASATGTARRAGMDDAKAVASAVSSGKESAKEVWRDTIELLADSLATMTATVAPMTIVIGGGLALAGKVLTDPLDTALEKRLGPLRRPRLVTARLGDRAAALGASLLARRAA